MLREAVGSGVLLDGHIPFSSSSAGSSIIVHGQPGLISTVQAAYKEKKPLCLDHQSWRGRWKESQVVGEWWWQHLAQAEYQGSSLNPTPSLSCCSLPFPCCPFHLLSTSVLSLPQQQVARAGREGTSRYLLLGYRSVPGVTQA